MEGPRRFPRFQGNDFCSYPTTLEELIADYEKQMSICAAINYDDKKSIRAGY